MMHSSLRFVAVTSLAPVMSGGGLPQAADNKSVGIGLRNGSYTQYALVTMCRSGDRGREEEL
jgi:hypothetical protein